VSRAVPPPGALDALAAESLRRGNRLRLRAHGDSMLPFLRDGDVLLVRPAARSEPQVGDVLCYEPPAGGLRLHRVIAREKRGFVTRGDALAFVERVPDAAVLGVAVAVQRRGRLRRLDTAGARWRGRIIARAAPVLAHLLPLARLGYRVLTGRRRG
jgi:hypothetical protein